MTATGRGWGKVILVGEHSVVYGQPALAAALAQAVVVSARPSATWRVDVPAWALALESPADDAHPVMIAVGRLADALAIARPFSLHADAEVPARAGLGSSAAFAVAVTRALTQAIERPCDDLRVADLANLAEATFHGQPSGLDVALATHGGIGLFRRGDGLQQLPLDVGLRPVLAIGLSGEPRSTRAMVERVRTAIDGRADAAPITALGTLALEAAAALQTGALTKLGRTFDDAHAVLATLGVSTPGLDRLVDAARARGALGAKLTGAGGGGAVIALAKDAAHAEILADGWRADGFASFTTQLA